MKPVLTLENVSFSYHTKEGETQAIAGLDFAVYPGEFVSVIGPSGCGKTTVLSLIAGLIKPSSGKITLFREEAPPPNVKAEKGGDKKTAKVSDRGKGGIGYMLQKDCLFPWLTIEKNVRLPLEIKRQKEEETLLYGDALLEKYGLKDFKKSFPSELSGGMRQRAALIRTLVFKPNLLLLDEPFSALDYQTRLSVADDVHRILKEEKCTAILVTHDIPEAISLSDRVLVLSPRPCRIKREFTLALKEKTPLLRRESPDFTKWFEILYKELLPDETLTEDSAAARSPRR